MQRNRFIDVFKGILIIFVIIFHFPFDSQLQQRLLFPFWVSLPIPFFMMISGYVSALSLQKRGLEHVEQAYKPLDIAEKMIRYMLPFTISFAAGWIAFRAFGLYTVNLRTYGIFALFLEYLRGGTGQGSYYIPMLMQFIFIFPVIYFVIKKHDFKGLCYCFLANGIYEVMKKAYGMSDVEYRLLVLRYLFVIAAGCYIAIGDIKKNRKTVIISWICIVVGLAFAYLFSYTSYNPKIITYLGATSFLVGLFVVPVFGWIIRNVHWSFKPLEIIGQASFNIFLIQMIYYNFIDRVYLVIPNRAAQVIFSIVNCVVAGLIFHYLEQPLTRFIITKIKKRKRENNEHD